MNTASPFIIERFKKAKQLEDKKGKQIKESKYYHNKQLPQYQSAINLSLLFQKRTKKETSSQIMPSFYINKVM